MFHMLHSDVAYIALSNRVSALIAQFDYQPCMRVTTGKDRSFQKARSGRRPPVMRHCLCVWFPLAVRIVHAVLVRTASPSVGRSQ